ncbi:Asp-tRNA(Asn)/Glu-tRNA(Gln) amidotransferase subunit GatC [Candidatus Viridilinea mediisalina]|uniref:Aspartyl/glutamyl-tRNA(Asn/Gln) amidotransferase subunit C n=1 Tax=Candidatus Viridilinea mediisalina TaxID=2024553 RepID=A0A2A6RKN7_9CHLR|nr:Asp-tRNA(Asn)/Glu-tRNA(Gln) amidotransferase subunit GatC [Candidatus Viridilinea mediisalina]PDW03684.1 Asp-tRNA(Asn)/Glu-tRNA(Gln) amidotransferase GatCAB subunit C [Candidatus Viridilinea mediisalina]
MALSIQEVAHVAQLARMRLSDEELELMQSQLSNILEYIELLQEVDVTGVEATAQVTGLSSVLRPDLVTGALSREEVLANAPDQAAGMFRVRAVFDE